MINLFIFVSSFNYLRRIKDELFVKITKTNFNYILYYLQNISLYITPGKMHFFNKKNLQNLKTFSNNIYKLQNSP